MNYQLLKQPKNELLKKNLYKIIEKYENDYGIKNDSKPRIKNIYDR